MLTATIYTLGDPQIFETTLLAVKSMFDSGMVDSAALAGLMITLLWSLAGGVLSPMGKGSFNPAILIVLAGLYLGFFSGVTAPKATIQIVDLYKAVPAGGTATPSHGVAGVPVGLVIPAAVISTVTYQVTLKVEEAFMGNTTGVPMTTQGFINPLRLLQTLKNPTTNVDPYIEASIKAFATDCVHGEGSPFKQNTFAWSRDAMDYFLNNYRDGLTVYFTKPRANASQAQIEEARQGVSINCATAADQIETDIHDFLGSESGLGAFLNLHMSTSTGQTNAVTGRPLSWQTTDMTQATQIVLDGVTQTSSQFMTNMLFASVANDAFNCAGTMADYQAAAACNIVMTQASEQWKADAAAAGSFFQKTMIPLMNMLLLLFYGLAPIMVIYVMMAGWNGLSILVKYFLFGVWTQSWMPFAVIVNAFMQLQTRAELEKIVTMPNPADPLNMVSGVTVATRMHLVDVLGTKVAAASEILAATPLITLSLLTGSIYGLVGMAQRFSGRDYTDEKQVAPSLMSAAPIMAGVSRFSGGMGMASGDASLTNGWTGTMADASAYAKTGARAEVDNAAHNLSQTVGNVVTNGNSKNVSWKDVEQRMAALGVTDTHQYQALQSEAIQFGEKFGLSVEQSKQIAASAMFGFKSPIVGTSVDGKSIDSDQMSRAYEEFKTRSTTGGLTRSAQRAFQENISKGGGKEAAFMNTLSEQDQKSFQDALTRSRSVQTSYGETESATQNLMGSISLTAQQIANAVTENKYGSRDSLITDGLRLRNEMGDAKFQQYQDMAARYLRTSAHESGLRDDARQAALNFHTMRIASGHGETAAMNEFASNFARMAGVDAAQVNKLAGIDPQSLGIKVDDPSSAVLGATSGSSAAAAAADGVGGVVGNKIKQSVPSPTSRAGQQEMTVKFNQDVDGVKGFERTAQRLDGLAAGQARAKQTDRIAKGSIMNELSVDSAKRLLNKEMGGSGNKRYVDNQSVLGNNKGSGGGRRARGAPVNTKKD